MLKQQFEKKNEKRKSRIFYKKLIKCNNQRVMQKIIGGGLSNPCFPMKTTEER